MAVPFKYGAAGVIAGAGAFSAGANIMSPFFTNRGASPQAQRENAAIEAALNMSQYSALGPVGAAAGLVAGGAFAGSHTTTSVFRAMRHKGGKTAKRAAKQIAGRVTRGRKIPSSIRRMMASNRRIGGMIGLGVGLAVSSELAVSDISGASGLQHDYLDASGNSDVAGSARRRTGGFSGFLKGAVGGTVTYAAMRGTGTAIQKGFGGSPALKRLGGFMKNPIVSGIAALGIGISMGGMMKNTQRPHNRIQGMGY